MNDRSESGGDGSGSEEAWTCGKGLAEHAGVPAGMAELLAALADNLRSHVPTIDVSDPDGRAERDAYVRLTNEYAGIAERLGATAERMRSYRDLAPAPHHEEALGDPALMRAFERFVSVEGKLADALTVAAERDRRLLEAFRAEG